jgi:hypothetical protein
MSGASTMLLLSFSLKIVALQGIEPLRVYRNTREALQLA